MSFGLFFRGLVRLFKLIIVPQILRIFINDDISHERTCFMNLRTTKVQISLPIHSAPLIFQCLDIKQEVQRRMGLVVNFFV